MKLSLLGAALLLMAVAPPARAHEFRAYFEWDRAELNEHGLKMVGEAASYSAQSLRTHVVAHADRSGPADYNQRLSERRAQAVADALIRAGVDPATLVVMGRGETQPAVSTPDGVREPANRRVTVHHDLR